MHGPKDHARILAFISFLVSAALTFVIDLRLQILAADDSYIHLRIARHLLETGHAYFNAGERVMVTSSPLWTILLSFSARFFHAIPPALPVESIAMGVAVSSAFLLAKSYAPNFISHPAERLLYLLLAPALTFLFLLQPTILEMETPLAVALLLLALYAMEREKTYWLAIIALAALTRYEYLLAFALFLFIGYRRHRLTPASLLLGAATFAAGLAWVFYQYGTIVPNTIRAKSKGYVLSFHEAFIAWNIGYLQCAMLAAVVVVLLIIRKRGQHQIPTALAVFGVGLAAIYLAKKTMMFPWYPALALTPAAVGLSLSLAVLPKKILRAGAILAILISAPWLTTKEELAGALTHRPDRAYDDLNSLRVVDYRAVGQIINDSCPKATLMTSEIGGLGDQFHGEILDAFGLASPQAIRYHPMPIPADRENGNLGAIPPAFVRDARPDVIVTYNLFGEALLARYDRTAYQDLTYPPLPSSMAHWTTRFSTWTLHILVARSGQCSASELDNRIRQALAKD